MAITQIHHHKKGKYTVTPIYCQTCDVSFDIEKNEFCPCLARRERRVGKNRRTKCWTCGGTFIFKIKFRNDHENHCPKCQEKIDLLWENLLKHSTDEELDQMSDDPFGGLLVTMFAAILPDEVIDNLKKSA